MAGGGYVVDGRMTATLFITSTVLLRLPIEDLGFRFRFGVPDAAAAGGYPAAGADRALGADVSGVLR